MGGRLADVAAKVGVSEATVSRVLNGKAGVSDSTRDAVLTALDVLGYERPSKLRGERARLVGLVLPELQNPIFPAFAEVVSGALAQHGYTPVLCTQTSGGIGEDEYVELLLSQQVSGIVFAGGLYSQADSRHGHYDRLQELNLPTVLVSAPAAGLNFHTVSADDSVAMEQAWNHLVQLGHTNIGLVLGPADHVPSRRKRAAADKMSIRTGIGLPDAHVEYSQYSLEAGQAATSRLINRGVTAVICASDPIALGAIRAVRRAGLDVPADVSIIGYDDSALMPSVDPPLTTVRQPIDAMGRMVVDLLVQQIAGTAAAPDEYLFEPELVVRNTTGRARSPQGTAK